MLVLGCAQTIASPTPSPTAVAPASTVAVQAIPTATVQAIPTATRLALAPTPTVPATDLRTFHAQIAFETYETEETVQLELGRLPGVVSINVTQLDVTVQYDGSRLSEDEILRTLRDNPEVRIKDDTRARH